MSKTTPFKLLVFYAVVVISFGAKAGEHERPPQIVYPWDWGKQLVRLGYDGDINPAPESNSPPKHAPADYAWVNAPQSVVDAGKSYLKGDPKEWDVNKMPDYNGTGQIVVFLINRSNNRFLAFLVDRVQWTRLNDRGGLPAMNKLLRSLPGRDVFHSKMLDRVAYLDMIANVYGGPFVGACRQVLDKYSLNRPGGFRQSQGKLWLGKEKRPEELYKLCGDPVCAKNGNTVKVKYNVLVQGGAVEEWAVAGTWDKGLVIRDIDVKLIRKQGTFDYKCLY